MDEYPVVQSWRDPLVVSDRVLQQLMLLEGHFAVHYKKESYFLNVKHRSQIVNWMLEVGETFRLNTLTFEKAVNIFDRAIMLIIKPDTPPSKCQTIALGALWIATKVVEYSCGFVAHLVQKSEDDKNAVCT